MVEICKIYEVEETDYYLCLLQTEAEYELYLVAEIEAKNFRFHAMNCKLVVFYFVFLLTIDATQSLFGCTLELEALVFTLMNQHQLCLQSIVFVIMSLIDLLENLKLEYHVLQITKKLAHLFLCLHSI